MAFNAKITPLLKAATILKINAVAVDTGQPISFPISLTGFSGAPRSSRPIERRPAPRFNPLRADDIRRRFRW
nr:hypothetical protein [Mesorhizobium temperatum]